jgi:hypothetical protein
MPSYLFLDTEWADPAGVELVSIALISEDGRQRFYAECSQLPEAPTPFVADVVYPLLERGAASMDASALREALWKFLTSNAPAYVLADYPNDIRLLRSALAGCSNDEQLPSGISTTVMDKEGRTAEWVEAWFRSRPKLAARRHHAMIDAQALRMAWRVVTGRITTDEWNDAHD